MEEERYYCKYCKTYKLDKGLEKKSKIKEIGSCTTKKTIVNGNDYAKYRYYNINNEGGSQ